MSTLFDNEAGMNTELVEIKHDTGSLAEPTPMILIQRALESGIDPSKLMDLAERWEKNRAAEAYGRAIAEFQSRMPVVYKSRTAKSKGDFAGYQYASFDDVMREAAPILKDCGIAISFSSEQVGGQLKITARVRHGIHAEDNTLTVPIPSMKVNETQKYGAALSYAKRYALCAALNIVVSDEDNDAEGLMDTISEQQLVTLEEWVSQLQGTGWKLPAFLRWLEVDSLSKISLGNYDKALNELQAAARKFGVLK